MDYDKYHIPPKTPKHQFKGWRIISDQVGQHELTVVWRELEKILNNKIPGDVVEFGCYAGTTSLFIRRLLDQQGQSQSRTFHVYDSFEGLPVKGAEDQSAAGIDFKAGKLSVGKKELLNQFKAAGLKPPITHKGWFNQLAADDVPKQIAFAFLDGDFYQSILDSLQLVWPNMAPGGVVIVDDYKREALPGVERAVQGFCQDNNIKQPVPEADMAVFRL